MIDSNLCILSITENTERLRRVKHWQGNVFIACTCLPGDDVFWDYVFCGEHLISIEFVVVRVNWEVVGSNPTLSVECFWVYWSCCQYKQFTRLFYGINVFEINTYLAISSYRFLLYVIIFFKDNLVREICVVQLGDRCQLLDSSIREIGLR